MRRLLALLIPVTLSAQIVVDTVVHLPSFIINGYYINELDKLYLIGWREHYALDCSTYQLRARIPRPSEKNYAYYSWNWRGQKLYISLDINVGEDSLAVVDAVADTLIRWIPHVRGAGVYVGSSDRFYRPVAHTLVALDCSTDTVVSTIPAPDSAYGFSHPTWDAVHNKLYVALDAFGLPPKLAVYDCATESLLTLIDVPRRPGVMNFDYADHKAYYTNWDNGGPAGAIDIEHDSVIRAFPFQSAPLHNGVALDTIDRKAYILGADTLTGYSALYVVDCATDSIVKMLTFPRRPWGVDHLRWVPWSNRVYLTRTQAPSHADVGMYVVDCNTDSIIVSDLVLGYYPPFEFQIDPIRERVFAIGCESTSVHVLRDTGYGGIADAKPGRLGLSLGLQVQMSDGGFDVRYTLASPSRVVLSAYDLMGREVRRLVAEKQSAGWHSVVWNCHDRNDSPAARGVYFIRLTAQGFSDVKKAVVTR